MKHFPLRDDYVYAQLSAELSESHYQELTGITPGEKSKNSSKGRLLVLCLDKSGSMSGSAFTALQQGTKMLGEQIFSSDDYEKVLVIYF